MKFRKLIVKTLQKLKFNKITHHIYYNYFFGFNTANKPVLSALEKCFTYAGNGNGFQEGDYLEFGLFKGYSFWYAQDIAKKQNYTNMSFFGFDSFSGLPEVLDVDRTKEDVFYKGQYSCSKEEVIKNLNSKVVDWERTTLVQGYYSDSLVPEIKIKYNLKKITIALIDCDLYESTKQVLDFIEGIITQDTILLFDDWNCFDSDNNKGQRRAVREFLKQNKYITFKEFFSYGTYGQVFIANITRINAEDV